MDASNYTAVPETSVRYEGWRIVAVCFLLATFGWGLGFYGQSVYVAELQRAARLAGVADLLGHDVLLSVRRAAGRLRRRSHQRYGPRNCLIAGIGDGGGRGRDRAGARALAALLANAVLAFGWAGTSLGMITNTLGLWFDKKRGMAISLALNGASFGGIVGVPLLVAAIGHFGFSGAMFAAAVAMLVLLVPVILIFVGRPPAACQARGGGGRGSPSPTQIRARALRDIGFLSVTIAFALVLFAQVGFIVHLISFLDSVIGRERAAVAVAC